LTAIAFDAVGQSTTSGAVALVVLPALVATYDPTLRVPRCSTRGISCDTGTLVGGRGTLGPELNRPNTVNASCAEQNNGTFHGTGESIDRVQISTVSGAGIAPGTLMNVAVTIWATNTGDRLDLWYAANGTSPSWVRFATLTPTTFNAASTLSRQPTHCRLG